MTMKTLSTSAGAFARTVLVATCLAGAAAETNNPTAKFSPDVGEVYRISDGSKSLMQPTTVEVEARGERHQVTLTLREERYAAQRTGEQRRTLYLYWLRGSTNGTMVTREIWSWYPLGRFMIVRATPSRTFLAWVDGTLLCLSDLSSSEPRPLISVTPDTKSHSQVDHMIRLSAFEGYHQFYGTRADHCDLEVLSADLATDGRITLNARNVFGQVFRFVGTGDQWRAFEGPRELPRHELAPSSR